MKYCETCGLEQLQLCFHQQPSYLSEITRLKTGVEHNPEYSPQERLFLINFINYNLNLKFYIAIMDQLKTIPEAKTWIQSPNSSYLKQIYQNYFHLSPTIDKITQDP